MADIDDGPPWGVDGPPDETYSRITRDLASIYDRWHRPLRQRCSGWFASTT